MNDSRSGGTGTGEDPREPRLAALYREAADAQPPAHLDTAIRAAARREVGAGPRATRPAFLRTWRLPVALAAVVVLSVSVVVRMSVDETVRLVEPGPPVQRSMQDETRTPAAKTERSEAAAPRPESPASAPARERAKVGMPEPRTEPPATGDAAPMAQRPAEIGAAGAQLKAPQASATRPSVAGDARERRAFTRDREPGPAAAEQAAPAPMGAAPAVRAAPGKATLAQEFENEPPEKWLEKVAELRRAGSRSEADELLQAFRRRFPDYPLPHELR